jgi:hypothetical protein
MRHPIAGTGTYSFDIVDGRIRAIVVRNGSSLKQCVLQVNQGAGDVLILSIYLISVANGDDVLPRGFDLDPLELVHRELSRSFDLVNPSGGDLVVGSGLRDDSGARLLD